MPADSLLALLVRKRTNIGLTGIFVREFRIYAGIGIVKEEIHAQQETSCEEPHGCKNDEGPTLVFALAINSVDKLFKWGVLLLLFDERLFFNETLLQRFFHIFKLYDSIMICYKI